MLSSDSPPESRGAPGVPVQSRGDPPGGGLAVVRRFGLAALPLALAGLLPWWCVLLLCALFAASAVSEAWRDGRLLLSVLVVGAAVVPGVLEAIRSGAAGWNLFLVLQNTYFVGLFGTLLLHWAASALAGGNRLGLLVTAGVGLIAPQPWLVLALAGGALSREGADDRLIFAGKRSQEEELDARRYAAWVAAALAFLVVFTFVLPRSTLTTPAPASIGPSRGTPPQGPEGTASTPPAPSEPLEKRLPETGLSLGVNRHVPTPPLELSLLMGAMMVLTLAYRLLSFRGRERRRPSLLEWLMAAALLLNFGLFIFMAQTPGWGVPPLPPAAGDGLRSGDQPGVKGPEVVRRTVPFMMDAMNLLVWLSLAFQAVLLVVMVAWVLQARKKKAAALSAAEGKPDVVPGDQARVSGHRVRLAYRAAQEALSAHGWSRLDSETPARYAARLSGARREFAPSLTLLTALYEPVRYGGRVTEQDADQAEGAARELTHLAALHPFIEPDEENQELA